MRSLRGTLTVWYTVALAAIVLAFGVTTSLLQGRANLDAFDQRLASVSDLVSGLLAAEQRAATRPLIEEFTNPVVEQRLALQARLDSIPYWLLVVDSADNAVYGSAELRRLSPQASDTLRHAVFGLSGERSKFDLNLNNTALRFAARRVHGAGSIRAIAVGEPTRNLDIGSAQVGKSMLLISPLILLFAVTIGYFLSARALRPVSRMIDELEAITDGRSLHRRLLGGASQAEELERLSSALNALLARLETSFDAMRRFVADASHEMKTPLMVMRAGVERTLTDPKTAPEALVPLEETLVGVRHMTELVDALLTLARVDEGRMELHRERMSLNELFADVYETAQILGEEAGVDVTLELPDEPVMVEVDGGRIRQLVMNLVTNAVKYTPAGGKVWMTLTGSPQAATVSLRDTGIGIAPGDVARVFDRFWRADPARSRTGERPGIGLGLAISKWIAEAHGGSIAVTSRPQRGSTFTVTLPRPEASGRQGALAAVAVTES
ncbi:MAG TPA: HAMP domain-containing sensor histidine kinase [Gemmatimonadales bacterium]